MIQYRPGVPEMDWALIGWHTRLLVDPDFDLVFTRGMLAPSAFLGFFGSPRLLYFSLDKEDQIEQAIWFEPSMSGAYVGFWVAPELRKSMGKRKMEAFFLKAIERVFEYTDVLLSTMRDRSTEALTAKYIRTHEELGWAYVGIIPHVFDGHRVHVMYLGKGEYYQAKHRREQRHKVKEVASS